MPLVKTYLYEEKRLSSSLLESYTSEDELLDMLADLPTAEQIAAIVMRLRVPTLRNMATDLLQFNVQVLRSPRLHPYEFAKRLESWLATAQEVIAANKRLRQILRDRDELRGVP